MDAVLAVLQVRELGRAEDDGTLRTAKHGISFPEASEGPQQRAKWTSRAAVRTRDSEASIP